MLRGSRAFAGKIHRPFLAQVVSPFHYLDLWWRHLAAQVGTTKEQGLYNKPSAAVHPGSLAAGTLPQYNTSALTYVFIISYLLLNALMKFSC